MSLLQSLRDAGRWEHQEIGERPKRGLKRNRTPTDYVPEEMTAADLINGRTLEVSARRCVGRCIQLAGRPSTKVKVKLRLGSVCSGSEMLSCRTHSLEEAMQAEGLDWSIEAAFVCDSDPAKLQWCMQVVDIVSAEPKLLCIH